MWNTFKQKLFQIEYEKHQKREQEWRTKEEEYKKRMHELKHEMAILMNTHQSELRRLIEKQKRKSQELRHLEQTSPFTILSMLEPNDKCQEWTISLYEKRHVKPVTLTLTRPLGETLEELKEAILRCDTLDDIRQLNVE